MIDKIIWRAECIDIQNYKNDTSTGTGPISVILVLASSTPVIFHDIWLLFLICCFFFLAKKDLAHDKDDLLIWLVSDDIFKIFGLTSKQHIRNKSQISWNITGVNVMVWLCRHCCYLSVDNGSSAITFVLADRSFWILNKDHCHKRVPK
jgi:hypothetical protein